MTTIIIISIIALAGIVALSVLRLARSASELDDHRPEKRGSGYGEGE